MVWLHREGNRQVPNRLIGLGTGVAAGAFCAGLFGAASGPAGYAGLASLALAGWIPLVVHTFQTRHELRLGPRGFAGSVSHWKGRVASRAEALEEAATDLDQVETLARRSLLDPEHAESLVRVANRRLRRMFELTVAAPARHGLTREGAEACLVEDGRWITEVRRLVERSLAAEALSEGDEPLAELRAMAEAREAALVELNR